MSTAADDRPPAPVPSRPTRARLQAAIDGCRGCDLWEHATQAVLGEGAGDASLMLVGEQPGDREDVEGHPFVGPAGRVLDRALQRAGIAREDVYVTNVVKHFRYEARGKRRIHQRPDRWQVTACLPWLGAEIELVRPGALVCLGATAAHALLGPQVKIGRDRGKPIDSGWAELVSVTAHPSSILRARDSADRERALTELIPDFEQVGARLSRR